MSTAKWCYNMERLLSNYQPIVTPFVNREIGMVGHAITGLNRGSQ
jgi:hypothetical protein